MHICLSPYIQLQTVLFFFANKFELFINKPFCRDHRLSKKRISMIVNIVSLLQWARHKYDRSESKRRSRWNEKCATMVFRRQTVDTNERHVIINCQQTCCCRISFGSRCVHNSISGYRFLKALTFGHTAARTMLLRLCSFSLLFSHSFRRLSVAYCDLSASTMKRYDRRLTDNHGKLTVCLVTIYLIFFLLPFFFFFFSNFD